MDYSPCRHLLPGRSARSLAPDEPGAIGFPLPGGFRFQSRARQDRIFVMSPVSLLLNIIWIVLGGAWMAFGWLVAAIVMAITIIGIPWARAAFNIAAYTLFPFGFTAISRDAYTRPGGYRHRPARGDRQHHLAGAGGMVAGARACHHGRAAGRDHHRDSLCLGAPEACRNRAMADRQGHRSHGLVQVCLEASLGLSRGRVSAGFSRSNSASLISVWATSTLQRRRLTR